MGVFLANSGQANPIDYDSLVKELKLDKRNKYGFQFIGDMRNPEIRVLQMGKIVKIKERKNHG